MIGVTLFGIFLTAVFFYVIRGVLSRRPASPLPEIAARPIHDGDGHVDHPATETSPAGRNAR